MLLDIILAVWIIWGIIALYQFNHRTQPPVKVPSLKGVPTAECHHNPACTHPEVEQVEVGDGILVPREVVAKICRLCWGQLPANYSSPNSVIMTDEKSLPFSFQEFSLSYWTEAQERLATGKDKQCHE